MSRDTRKRLAGLSQTISADLRRAAKLFDRFDRSLQSAWRLFEGLLESLENASAEPLDLAPSKPPVVRSGKDLMRRHPRRKRRATIDWAAVRQEVRVGLEKMGGSGTLANLLEQTPCSYSRIKRGLAMLEKAGVVERSGVKRTTRYHLTSNKPEGS